MSAIIITLLILSSVRLFSQESWTHSIDSLFEESINEHTIKGITVGIVFDNKIQYVKCFGELNTKTNEPITPQTPFLTASISKVFVATANLQLQEKQLLDINEKIIRYIPEFTMKDSNYKEITIKHLLNHSSGLTEGSSYKWDKAKNKNLDIKSFTLSLSKRKLLFKPGEKFSYSNTAYVILGYIIEKITNQTFNTYIEENILKPVGMTSSSFDMNYFNTSYFPHYYNLKDKKQEHCISNTSPGGNLISSTSDLCKWMLYNLSLYKNELPSDATVISKESQTLLWTPTQTFEEAKQQ